MLNKRPIIINAFARGGSNMLVNMLISHPHVCISSGETHKVFKPGTRFDQGWLSVKKRYLYDLPIRALMREDFFNPHWLHPRKPMPAFLRAFVDRLLYHGRFDADIATHNLLQYENLPYTRQELAKCRLLTKSLNGLIYVVPLFAQMYPDATFIGLLRNGLAVCEGRSRRNYPASRMAEDYRDIVERMLAYEAEMENYHVVRYEDMVEDPVAFLHKVYAITGLDIAAVPRIRLESKAVVEKDGQHRLSKGEDREVFWYEPEEIRGHIRRDINENQIKRLSRQDYDDFMAVAGETMEKLGYSTSHMAAQEQYNPDRGQKP